MYVCFLMDLIRTVFIAWFKNKNVYLRKLTFKML